MEELLPLLREALNGASRLELTFALQERMPLSASVAAYLLTLAFRRCRACVCAAPELDAARVAAALAHSTVVVAAYVSDAGGGASGDAGGSAAPASGVASASAVPSPPPPPAGGLGWLIPKPPARRLVGFARAASDRTLVALVADVAVAPAHRRAGVGSRLLFALLDELRALGIGDVGALTADSQRPFFRRGARASRVVCFADGRHLTRDSVVACVRFLRCSSCRFGPDREGAVHMALPRHARGGSTSGAGGNSAFGSAEAAAEAAQAAAARPEPASYVRAAPLHARLRQELTAATAAAATAAAAAAAAAAAGDAGARRGPSVRAPRAPMMVLAPRPPPPSAAGRPR